VPFVEQKHSRSKVGRNIFTGLKNGHKSERQPNSSLTNVMKKVEKGGTPSKEVLNTVRVRRIGNCACNCTLGNRNRYTHVNRCFVGGVKVVDVLQTSRKSSHLGGEHCATVILANFNCIGYKKDTNKDGGKGFDLLGRGECHEKGCKEKMKINFRGRAMQCLYN
jgi:hypothetical protein